MAMLRSARIPTPSAIFCVVVLFARVLSPKRVKARRGEDVALLRIAVPMRDNEVVHQVAWITGPRNEVIDLGWRGQLAFAVKAQSRLQFNERVAHGQQ